MGGGSGGGSSFTLSGEAFIGLNDKTLIRYAVKLSLGNSVKVPFKSPGLGGLLFCFARQ